MKKALELILKVAKKDCNLENYGWLGQWLKDQAGVNMLYTDTVESRFTLYPKLLNLLVIDLAPEIWKDLTDKEAFERGGLLKYNEYGRYRREIINFLDAENKVEWITKELEGR